VWLFVARKRLPTPFTSRATKPSPTLIVLPVLTLAPNGEKPFGASSPVSSPQVCRSNFVFSATRRSFRHPTPFAEKMKFEGQA
jgi:hypothetical protein